MLPLLMLLLTTNACLPDQIRGVWSAWGMQAGKWDQAAETLAAHGFNLVFANMIYGCAAAFETDVFPQSELFANKGDLLAECILSCDPLDIDVHVSVTLWRTERAPEAFFERMQSEDRLQISSTGEESSWLCPTDLENRDLMLSIIVEVVSEYDVEGIHLDFIRFPNTRNCFCSGCRERFSASSGITLRDWPGQVLEGGRYFDTYREWRIEQITSFVRHVRNGIEEIRPGVLLSAAVLKDRNDGLRNGQDWVGWVEEGLIDFVVPMNYTDSLHIFRALLEDQMESAGGFPVVAGIGVFSADCTLGPEEAAEQAELSSEAGSAGYALFHLNRSLMQDILPAAFP